MKAFKIYLNNGKCFDCGKYVTICSYTDTIRQWNNQTGYFGQLETNQNCDLIERLSKQHIHGFTFLKIDNALIPLTSITYIEQVDAE